MLNSLSETAVLQEPHFKNIPVVPWAQPPSPLEPMSTITFSSLDASHDDIASNVNAEHLTSYSNVNASRCIEQSQAATYRHLLTVKPDTGVANEESC